VSRGTPYFSFLRRCVWPAQIIPRYIPRPHPRRHLLLLLMVTLFAHCECPSSFRPVFIASRRLPPGTRVTLQGLVAKPELNGQTGVVVSGPNARTGRFTVQLDGGSGPFELMPANLEPTTV